MAIDRFNKLRFECALPKSQPTNDEPAKPLCQSLGIIQGEECYLLQPFPHIPLALFIRSSVSAAGVAADTGEDSIRVRICESSSPYRFVGNKSQSWTTRVSGWEQRLLLLMRKLANAIKFCRPCPCCSKRLTPLTVKSKDNGNAGRTFVACDHCKKADGRSAIFYWCESDKGEFLPLPEDLKKSLAVS